MQFIFVVWWHYTPNNWSLSSGEISQTLLANIHNAKDIIRYKQERYRQKKKCSCLKLNLLTTARNQDEKQKSRDCICCLQSGAQRGKQGGHNSPGSGITVGCRKVPAVSQVLNSMQYIYSQKSLGLKMGRQTCFLPRAPSNLRMPRCAVKKIHSLCHSILRRPSNVFQVCIRFAGVVTK